MANEVVIKFSDLRLHLQNRRVPLMPKVIAWNTQYFGKSVGLETVRRFFRGGGSTTAVSFAVIKATIEGSENIVIDFDGSPYDIEAAPAPETEGRPSPAPGKAKAPMEKPVRERPAPPPKLPGEDKLQALENYIKGLLEKEFSGQVVIQVERGTIKKVMKEERVDLSPRWGNDG